MPRARDGPRRLCCLLLAAAAAAWPASLHPTRTPHQTAALLRANARTRPIGTDVVTRIVHNPRRASNDTQSALHLKAAVRRGKIPVVFVQFGSMPPKLRDAIKIAMGWGNVVVLLSDVACAGKYFGPALARRFHYFPIDCAGCDEYGRVYNAFHSEHAHVFRNYPFQAELWNEVRYLAMANFVDALEIDQIVYLDSDVALLAPAAEVFDDDAYRGCDAVFTFNQISARDRKPIAAPNLEAFWAGTGLLSRAVLRQYSSFTWQVMLDPVVSKLLLGKMRSQPTINDMTTWMLFTLINRSPAARLAAPVRQLLESSALSGTFLDRLTVCNTQSHMWEPDSSWTSLEGHVGAVSATRGHAGRSPRTRGILQSASGELQRGMIVRQGAAFYVHGGSYVANFCGLWPDDLRWINSSAIIRGGWWRVLSVHKLYYDEAARFYDASTNFTGSAAYYLSRREADRTGSFPLERGLRAASLGFRPASEHACTRK